MLDKKIHQLIVDTSEKLVLVPSIVEKDYYVTQVLSILAKVANDYTSLVFAGGTCLAKAHRVVKRMSEDVDFKFQKKPECSELSKNSYLKTLKTFRDEIIYSLEKNGFICKKTVVRNEGKYLSIELEYTSVFDPNPTLRPHLLLEFTASEISLPTQMLPITTLIQDTLQIIDLESFTLPCISIEETAAEKWVGLTRRLAASERGHFKEDPTLVRHVYDLSIIYGASEIGQNFFSLAEKIIFNDANQFKNQYPEYFSNPKKEIQRSLDILKNNPEWEKRYFHFMETISFSTNFASSNI
jgi:predicted nucleotidyltransferase component of viral defense system